MGRRGDPNFGCFRWKYQNMSFDLKFICHSLTIKPCEVHSSIIQAISYITLKSILGKLRGVETLNVFIENTRKYHMTAQLFKQSHTSGCKAFWGKGDGLELN